MKVHTAGAPFMGGAWEKIVQLLKRALNIMLHEKYPSEEVLITLLAEIENSVNSKSLTHVLSSPKDSEAITPNHFLLVGSSRIQTIRTFDDTNVEYAKDDGGTPSGWLTSFGDDGYENTY
ncbi:hypothetical protein EVAR_28813_1 [Eumeta japonica]|uniref:Uncharacterized protein n=1 Tax=Eumeta variegata TaxID=151549 RepID=A0A4C1WHU6_EUMVA|nr:hypothetical protein EVAR_28813_1 [Eumeta japonica]